ncbi:MAG: hypothetical protein LBP30_04600 [Clostridiales Family XIII bacterium]|jgi:hypothetical protein|nr:hypothetical protein [Clostridiales Family XIII bacterium]
MKKILFIALAMAAVLVFVQFYRFTALGELGYSALALPDESFIEGLTGQSEDEDLATLTPERIGPFDMLYERAGLLYAGDRKKKLDKALPLFANEATAMLSISDDLRLVTDDFERLPGYYGLLVSDGRSFNPDMTPADPYDFILVQMKKNVFGNAIPARVQSGTHVAFIPINSLMYHRPDGISYYAYDEGKFVLRHIDGLSSDSVIAFDDKSYGYHEYLYRLGLLPDVRPLPVTPPDWPDTELTSAQGDGSDADRGARGGAARPAPPQNPADPLPADPPGVSPDADWPEPKKPEKPKTSLKPSPDASEDYGPFLSLGKFGGNFNPPLQNDYVAESKLRIYDPNEALVGSVRVYLTLTVFDKVYTQTWQRSTGGFEGADIGYITRIVKFEDLEWGATYEIYGEYDYVDKDGVLHENQRFGEQKLKIELKEEQPADPSAPGFNYVKPTMTVGEFTADVYAISGSTTINDPTGRIVGKGVTFEFKRDGKTIRRVTISQSGPFDVDNLPPNTKYEIIPYFEYRDEKGTKLKEELPAIEIETLPISMITAMLLNAEPGDLYADSLELKGMYMDTDPEKGKTPGGRDARAYVKKIVFTADGKDSALSSSERASILAGDETVFRTSEMYESYKEYDYVVKAYDAFGNELPLDPKVEGKLKTCKATPEAKITAGINAVANVRLNISFKDKDGATSDPSNRKLTIYEYLIGPDGEAALIPAITEIRREDGTTGGPSESHFVPGDASIVITNLSPGKSYKAVITCDYDLEDGKAPVTGAEIGSLVFMSSGIESLGKLSLSAPQEDMRVSASAVGMNVEINKGATNETLLLLLSEVTLTATPKADPDDPDAPIDPDDIRTVTFARGDADFDDWTTGAAIWWAEFNGLESDSDYELTASAKVELGGASYDVPATINPDAFITLKKPARLLVGGMGLVRVEDPPPPPPFDRVPVEDTYFIASNSIDLFDVSVDDPDHAITRDGKAMLVVTDIATKEIVLSRALSLDPKNPDLIALENLQPEHEYAFNVYATEYNEGRDAKTLVFNKEIDHFGLVAKAGLSGSVRLYRVAASLAPRYYDATFTVELTDIREQIEEDGEGYYWLRLKRLGWDGQTVVDSDEIPKFYNPGEDPDTHEPKKSIKESVTLEALPERSDYVLELFVKLGPIEKTLGSIAFDTQGPVEFIATMKDFNKITNNNYAGKNGRFVVVNDLFWDHVNPDGIPNNADDRDNYLAGVDTSNITNDTHTFGGMIDFQGYTMKVDVPGRRFLFWTMNGNGVIKNGVFDITLSGDKPVGEYGLLIHRNRGTVSNVIFKVKGNNRRWNGTASLGVIASDNTGIIENFVVCFEDAISAINTFGVVTSNTGTVRNGYIYAAKEENVAVEVPHLPNAGATGTVDVLGGVVASNGLRGLVENVYSLVDIKIEGGSPPSVNIGGNGSRIGTLVGVNAGTVRNAYSAGQVYYEARASWPGEMSTAGTMQEDPSDPGWYHTLRRGPGVGSQNSKFQTSVYYYSGDSEAVGAYGLGDNKDYNTRVMSDTLRREDWQSSVLGAGFDVANTVPMGYYPHVKMSAVMPRQDYVRLPDATANNVELVNALVETQRENYAVVVLTLKNKDYRVFRDLRVENMDKAFVLGPNMFDENKSYLKTGLGLSDGEIKTLSERVQLDKDGLSRVWVLLAEPKKYYSRYLVTDFLVTKLASAPVSPTWLNDGWDAVNNDKHAPPNGGFPVDAEFFKSIGSESEWTSTIVAYMKEYSVDYYGGNDAEKSAAAAAFRAANPPQNYRLKADLVNFAGMPAADIRVGNRIENAAGASGNNDVFGGKLDGGIYDDDMNLVGVHSLENITLAPNDTQGGGVFAVLTGTVSNLLVKNLTIDAPENQWVGFVRALYGGGVLRNVRLVDIDYVGPASDLTTKECFMGGLVARQHYGDVADSSVSGAKLVSRASNVSAGGLTGYLEGSNLRNSWVYGLDMEITAALMARGVGGVAGVASNSELRNLYAAGGIETSDQHAGGIIGNYANSSILQNTWNKVNIRSMTDRLGGVAGTQGSAGGMPLNSLALGDLSSAAALYTGTADGDAIHRIAGNGAILKASDPAVAIASNNAYALDSALINGDVPRKLNDQSVMETIAGDATLLHIGDGSEDDPYDLKNPRTYTNSIRLGNAFVYNATDPDTGISELQMGILPKLRSEAGELLAGQSHVYMGEASISAEVLLVVAGENNKAAIYVQHPEGTALQKFIELEYWPGEHSMKIETDPLTVSIAPSLPNMVVSRIDVEFIGKPQRRLDSYNILSVRTVGSDVNIPVKGEVNFPIRWYWDIDDLDDWQTLMALEAEGGHGDTFENFQVFGNVDFSAIPAADVKRNLSVNRLEAVNHPETPAYRLSGYTGSVSLLRIVAGELSGLIFSDMEINPGDNGVGVVGKAQGLVRNMAFEDIKVGVSGTARSYVGCFGNLSAKVKNVNLSHIRVRGNGNVGGLAGYGAVSDLDTVSIDDVIVSGTGSIVGGLIGYASSTEFANCKVTNALVKTNGDYAGGMAGYESSLKGFALANPKNIVENAVVQGRSRVGGLFGEGQTNNNQNAVDKSHVKNVFIRAAGDSAGGMAGNGTSWWHAGMEVRDSYIFGQRSVSGYAAGNSIAHFNLVNSVVSTNNYRGYDTNGDGNEDAGGYDAWRTEFLTRQTGKPLEELITEAGGADSYIEKRAITDEVYSDIGGVNSGTAPQQFCVVAYSFVGGKAHNVGGLRGSGSTSTSGRDSNYCLVIGTTVRGEKSVGGAIGSMGSGQLVATAINADVAGLDDVGGVFGRMGRKFDLSGDKITHIGSVYFVGNVTATAANGRAAGLANMADTMMPMGIMPRAPAGNLVAANIKTGAGGSAAFFYNRLPGDDWDTSRHAVFKGSTIKVGTSAPTAPVYTPGDHEILTANWIWTTEMLKNYGYWRDSLGGYFGANNAFNYGGLNATTVAPVTAPKGFMPYRTMQNTHGGWSKIVPYQNGKDGPYGYNDPPTVSNYYTLTGIKGGIPIPTDTNPDSIVIVTMAMEPALVPQQLPAAEIYAAGGASGLNLEFDAENPETYFRVTTLEGVALAESRVERRAYTLDYDFATPLTVEVSDGYSSEFYHVDPAALRRSVMLEGDNFYYTDGLGLRDKDNRLLPGDFINLRDGQALNSDGSLYDAVTGLPLTRVPGIAVLREEASPLYRFALSGYEIETYAGFSLSRSADGAESLLPSPAIVKNGKLTLYDPDMSDVYDSLISDARGGEEYLSVLDGGRIRNERAPLAMPSEFKNAGLAHFAHNLNTELPYVLARYKNGLVNGFNYLTGELLNFESKGDLSLLDYAADYFTSAPDPRESEAARGYMELKPLQEALTVHGLGELLEGAENAPSGDSAGVAGASAANGGGVGNGQGGGDDPFSAGGGAEATGASAGEATDNKPGAGPKGETAPAGEGSAGETTDGASAGGGKTAVAPRGDALGAGQGAAMNGTGQGNGTATAVGTGAGNRQGTGAATGDDPAAGEDKDKQTGEAATDGDRTAAAGEGATDEGTAGGAADAATGEGADGEAEAAAGEGAADGAADAATGEGTAGETAASGEGAAGGASASANRPAHTGDLSIPKPPEKKTYTAVYDAKTGQYVFYDVDSLLAAGDVEPAIVATEESKTRAAEILAEAEAAEALPTDNPMFDKGIKVLLALFLASFLLLYIGLNRRSRKRRA